MLKCFLILIFATSQASALTEKKSVCRFDLVGNSSLPDSILDKTLMTRKACHEKALKLIALNPGKFTKIIFHHSQHSVEIVELERRR